MIALIICSLVLGTSLCKGDSAVDCRVDNYSPAFHFAIDRDICSWPSDGCSERFLNPRTGHVSPQFHVVYDDNFTTVPYLRTGTVPPHWAELVRESSQFQQVDSSQNDTWQSLATNGLADAGDFGSDDAFPQADDATVVDIAHNNTQPDNTATQSSLARDREGVNVRHSGKVTFEADPFLDERQQMQMPEAINLEQSGLRRSPRLAALRAMEEAHPNRSTLHGGTNREVVPGDGTTWTSYATRARKKACLIFFSLFCTVGAITAWTFTSQTTTVQPKFVLRVHEDNQSCIAMANNPKFTPRTKHISIKFHHFRKHVRTPTKTDGFIDIEYCPTDQQLADIFTKHVSDDAFWRLRKLLIGW